MGQGRWRTWIQAYTYRRAYVDRWGVLHDPTTTWDELLKYYRHWELLKVSEAARKVSQPASAGAQELIQKEKRRHRRNLRRTHNLEAQDLQSVHRQKQWKRRNRNKKKRARSQSNGKRP